MGHALVAEDTATNQAMLASSNGAVGGPPPLNTLVDLRTGQLTQWNGLNNGFFGAGFVNGLAVDSTTGMACTTTELNSQVEFYDLADQSGLAVQLPGTTNTDQVHSGAAVASDPVHGLFLVADPVFAPTGDSAIVVYDEQGRLVESITGFNFSIDFEWSRSRWPSTPSSGWMGGQPRDQSAPTVLLLSRFVPCSDDQRLEARVVVPLPGRLATGEVELGVDGAARSPKRFRAVKKTGSSVWSR